MTQSQRETGRRQFHFSCRRGWLNDPNGLCFYRGIYHLFYQHNPVAPVWGPMHWGHAVSRDLLHWQEREIALYPDQRGTIFSGGAVADLMNVSGLGSADNPPLLFFYTCAGSSYTQNIAVSLDGGMTLLKYSGNPVVPNLHGGEERDPSVVFDPDSGKWLMALYLGDESHEFALLESPDLLRWRETDRFPIPGGRECPELLRLKDRVTGEFRWVLLEANGLYRVGTMENGRFQSEYDGTFMFRPGARAGYAGQTFKNQPDRRCIFMAWLQDIDRGTEFSQAMTLPMELRLDNGRLLSFPLTELERLRQGCQSGENVRTLPLNGELYELEFEIPATKAITLNLGGCRITPDPVAGTLRCNDATFPLPSGALLWRAWLDGDTLELAETGGRLWFALPLERRGQPVIAVEGAGTLPRLTAWQLTPTVQS